jgi:hypothetical protein
LKNSSGINLFTPVGWSGRGYLTNMKGKINKVKMQDWWRDGGREASHLL